MKIYVGNLSYDVTEEDLRQTFEAFGHIASASIIKDKSSGQSKVLDSLRCRRARRLRLPSAV